MRLNQKLIDTAKSVNWSTQGVLLKVEDEYIERKESLIIMQQENEIAKRYLALGSIPYVLGVVNADMCQITAKEKIEQLWPDYYFTELDAIASRPQTLPTGNINAKYMIIGDAPGRGQSPGKYDRTLAYGPSSHMLRKALISIEMHYACWYTNLSKLSMPENRPTLNSEVLSQKSQLIKEIEIIHPNFIILLGKHVEEMFFEHILLFGNVPVYNDIRTCTIQHPSYVSRKNYDPKLYGKMILAKIKEVL